MSSFFQELVKAIPVLVGGALAILGGVAGQLITHRLAIAREKKTHRRERIELLVKALYAHSQWLDERFNTMIFLNQEHDVPSPLSEAEMLKSLYFPELQTEISAIMQAQIPMMKFISDQRIERMKDEAAWIKAWNRESYDAMYKTHLIVLSTTTKKCREMLRKELES